MQGKTKEMTEKITGQQYTLSQDAQLHASAWLEQGDMVEGNIILLSQEDLLQQMRFRDD